MRLICCAAATACLAGCRVPSPLSPPTTTRPLGRDLAVIGVPTDPAAYPAAVSVARETPAPTGEVTLRDALAAALLRHPELAAYSLRMRAREAEILQASRWPNPEAELEVENVLGTGDRSGFDAAEVTLAVAQTLPAGGDLLARTRVARAERDLAAWDYEATRLDVFATTAMDFVDVLAAQRRVGLAEEAAKIARRVAEAVDLRVGAGQVAPVEGRKAAVEVARARLAVEAARRDLDTARVRLAANWGEPEPAFDLAAGTLEDLTPPPPLEPLVEHVLANPALARFAAEAALRRARLELALAERVPDVTLAGGVKYARDADDVALVAGLSLPLPIFDRNEGAIEAARWRLLENERLREAAEVRVRTALATTHRELVAAHERAVALRDEILPAARATFDAVEEAFRQGKVDVLDLLDAERVRYDTRVEYLAALAEVRRTALALERLSGVPLAAAPIAPELDSNASNQPDQPTPGETP